MDGNEENFVIAGRFAGAGDETFELVLTLDPDARTVGFGGQSFNYNTVPAVLTFGDLVLTNAFDPTTSQLLQANDISSQAGFDQLSLQLKLKDADGKDYGVALVVSGTEFVSGSGIDRAVTVDDLINLEQSGLQLTTDVFAERRAGLVDRFEFGEPGDIDAGVSPEQAQAIALLYEAGLGRPAAYIGLNFWIDRFEAGNSLNQIAQAFLDSPEFAAKLGDPATLSDDDLINGLFVNVIGRPPGEAGFAFWTGRLADGASRAEVLRAFATAPENAAQSPDVFTLRPIGDGDGPDRDPDDKLVDDSLPEWDFAG